MARPVRGIAESAASRAHLRARPDAGPFAGDFVAFRHWVDFNAGNDSPTERGSPETSLEALLIAQEASAGSNVWREGERKIRGARVYQEAALPAPDDFFHDPRQMEFSFVQGLSGGVVL